MHNLKEKILRVNPENCCISEITLAELKFGAENSLKKEMNRKVLADFISGISILPIFHALDLYAVEKARLRKEGKIVDDFDLLIGVTAVSHNLVMVTNNTSHLGRISGIIIEDWTLL